MNIQPQNKLTNAREFLFQLVLHVVALVFYSVNRQHFGISGQEFSFFCNYAFAALIINYVLLSRFYYQKKYLQFFIAVSLVLAFVMLVEELVLEPIYFQDTRAKGFPGVFLTLVGIVPVTIILVGFKFAWDAMKKQQEVDELRHVANESELQYLKTQINPHFLFNNLNNLYSYAITQSPKTPDIILELSGMLRYMLYDCKARFVPLTKEIKHLHNVINLSELQIEERGRVNFTVGEIREGYQIAPLILVVFIENAFKHSTASQTDAIFIDVEINLSDDGVLEFICKNSYQQQSNTDNLAKGIGLENVSKRLDLQYPGTHQLQIEKDENTYTVSLKLELTAM